MSSVAIPVLILGESGTGKSASLRNFQPSEIGLVNVEGKPLPFRTEIASVESKDFDEIAYICKNAKSNAVFVDDFGYCITDFYVKNCLDDETAKKDQFEVYKKLAAKVYKFFETVKRDGNPSKLVYLVMHTERDAFGDIQPLTVGKLLNEKIKIVGKVTICFLSHVSGGKYTFITNGTPPAKSPIGMFEDSEIDNDLKAIDATIREYYGLEPLGGGKQ